MCVFFCLLMLTQGMLSSSIYGSQMATFKKNYVVEKNNTFVRLVKKKEYGVKATAVGFFLIGGSNYPFKPV